VARFRILLITLVIWLSILFNIERPNWFGLGVIDLSSVVYVYAGAMCLVILMLPDLGYIRSEFLGVLALALYLPIRLAWTHSDPSHADISILIIELVVVFLTAVVSRIVSLSIANFEKAVENVVLVPEGSRMLPTAEGEEKINNELFRARRYERPVSLLVIHANEIKSIQNRLVERFSLEAAFRQRYLQNKIVQVVDMSVYRSDIVTTYQDDIVVCLPETADEDAKAFAAALYNMLKIRLNLKVEIGLAVFPRDALISQDLIQMALNHLIKFESDDDQTPPSDTDDQTKPQKPETELEVKVEAEEEELENTDEQSGFLSAFKNVSRSIIDVIPSLEPMTAPNPQEKSSDPDFWVYRFPYSTLTSRSIYGTIKRSIDVIVVMLALPFALPLMGIIALIIYLNDRGPVLFVQERTGVGGRRFKMYKFRSMVVNAEQLLIDLAKQGQAKLDHQNRLAEPLKMDRDPRITKIGRFLRKTSLDELPQLFNVLRGDMSLVGPRPTSWGLDSYTLLQTERLSVRPGITGLWQVCSRGTTDFNLWLKWDIIYIDKMSLMFDLKILLQTVNQVVASKGAR
jgi:lipopolysaccharide/colanic/teichoic acid biosynthesis glycosyltransferase